MYTIRDRQACPAITTQATKDVSVEDWPFELWAMVALVMDKEFAERIVRLLNKECGKEE